MSNLAPFKNNPQPGLPTPPRGDTIARFGTYLEAQKAVDYLSDNHFPVQAVTIVGVDLQMVERVTGRLTYTRVAIAGLLSGAWFGLFVGLLLLIFSSSSEGSGISVFAAMIIGAAFGGLFGLISYSFTGGRRDFTSTSQIVAGEYRVLCLTEQAGQAMQLLGRLAREGGPSSNDSGSAAGGPSAFGSGGPSAPATAPVTPAPGVPVQPFPSGNPAPPEPGAPPAEPAAPVTGPTYSEMIDRKKAEDRERDERERAERQQADVKERADREQAEAQRQQDEAQRKAELVEAEAREKAELEAAEAREQAERETEARERAEAEVREQAEREAAEAREAAEREAAEAKKRADRERAEAQAAPTEVHPAVTTPTTVQVPVQDPPA